jgi:ubiquinone biosynthesis protein
MARVMAVGVARARDHREGQIAEVLGRYELSHLAGVLGFERLVSAADGLIRREPPESHTEPENLRLALEELGPTFIKLGQLLSTRADLLSPDYRAELSKLQDAAPAVPSEVVKDIVERELHAPADTAFATFEAVPLACASVRAKIRTGSAIAAHNS